MVLSRLLNDKSRCLKAFLRQHILKVVRTAIIIFLFRDDGVSSDFGKISLMVYRVTENLECK